jgi:hypothetical protein
MPSRAFSKSLCTCSRDRCVRKQGVDRVGHGVERSASWPFRRSSTSMRSICPRECEGPTKRIMFAMRWSCRGHPIAMSTTMTILTPWRGSTLDRLRSDAPGSPRGFLFRLRTSSSRRPNRRSAWRCPRPHGGTPRRWRDVSTEPARRVVHARVVGNDRRSGEFHNPLRK